MSTRVSAVFLYKMLQLNAVVRRNTCLSPKPGYIWGPFRNQKGRTKTISICFLIVREDINRNEPACVLGYEFNKVNAGTTAAQPSSRCNHISCCMHVLQFVRKPLTLCTVHSYCSVFCYTPLSETELKGVFSNVSWHIKACQLGGSILSGKDKQVSPQQLVQIAYRKILKGRGSSQGTKRRHFQLRN